MGITDWKHWLVIIVVAVLLFGTKRLKTLGPDLGEAIKGFRRAMSPEAADSPSVIAEPSPTLAKPGPPAVVRAAEVPASSQGG
ncbi:twin-arginine translocase TatA/TatE family subunit [Pseudomonas sp. BN417]|uniref:twin-arginine translocase TatA/TatE family subunit n=1 Tax=Pseudomonas sp. BN417 TaxID=2567890 RepID=UPI00245702B4|nr:twin-arginine translocase TatA/TatE family subunit [Pseudomonas sp. BN417]MDH4555891.1 twin-arginine translocase TatA/TatE family subunit [Pseudomonas sp. BN417]